MAASIILKTETLTRKFDHLIAVDALNLAIEKNIIFGLIGHNGAGKSTLIKMLTTLLPPSSGDAYIDGVSIVHEPRKIRALIGYVPQLVSADGALTAYENLMFFAQHNVIGVLIFILLEASIFATLSSIVACLVKTRERFLGIGQVITMPLFFASNAIYPIAIMPHWLQIVSHWNPLTYEIDALRSLMLTTTPSAYGLATDFCILFFTLAVLTAIGGWVYPKIAR